VTYWSDVPPATKDYVAAREAIVVHIESLVPTLATTASATSLKGVVASVDERNDRISIRLQSTATGETTEDYKVQDGLVFDAVRFGDAVAFTVETIKGAKTITGLTKE
jgi:Cu/Ag efflux protein CusF